MSGKTSPYRIRFFAETGCDFALWGDPFRPLPVNGEFEADDLDNVLPISATLRSGILDWAGLYLRHEGGCPDTDMSDFEERGLHPCPGWTAR